MSAISDAMHGRHICCISHRINTQAPRGSIEPTLLIGTKIKVPIEHSSSRTHVKSMHLVTYHT